MLPRIIFMGTPEFAVPSLQILVEAGYDVVAVVTATGQEIRSRARHPGIAAQESESTGVH